MNKTKLTRVAAVLCLGCCMVVSLAGCSVLPNPEDSTRPKQEEKQEDDGKGIISKDIAEILGANENIEQTKERLSKKIEFLFKLPPVDEKDERRQQFEDAMPYTEITPDVMNAMQITASESLKDFLADYSSEAYTENIDSRKLHKIYNGKTSEELNGGIVLPNLTTSAGYWRITDCVYYNTVFFTNGSENVAKILYRSNMFHYNVMPNENLAATDNNGISVENTIIDEYPDTFLVVTINNVRPGIIDADFLNVRPLPNCDDISKTILAFTSYDDVISSFSKPIHSFEQLNVDSGFDGEIVDGFRGKPLVNMPEIVGKFIDVSRPNKIKELDDLFISNYVVEWVENDGSLVAYSVQESSTPAGNVVDIADMNKENLITVKVAKKAMQQ